MLRKFFDRNIAKRLPINSKLGPAIKLAVIWNRERLPRTFARYPSQLDMTATLGLDSEPK
jgi:hypothetical protein